MKADTAYKTSTSIGKGQLMAQGSLGQLCSNVLEHSVTGGAGQSRREASETAAKSDKENCCPVRTGTESRRHLRNKRQVVGHPLGAPLLRGYTDAAHV